MEDKFPILIHFRSKQMSGEQVEVSEFTSEGILYKKENFDYLQFKEVINEMGTVNTIIKIAENEISIIRKGSVSMNQRFLLNERTAGVYRTAFGMMEIETKTSKIMYTHNLKENKGTFILNYNMAVQKEMVGDHQIRIDFEGRTK